ncbi:MAG: DUF6504 family protein [Alphaproteobacteria bacterium]
MAVLPSNGAMAVYAVNAAAEVEGILPGMGLADARTLVPDLLMATADPAGDAAALRHLAQWCERYTPWVTPDGAEGLLLDISGCAHLFGDEARLLADLGARLTDMGLASRSAAADTPGAAWAVSRHGREPETVVAPGGQRRVLAALPVASLRLDPAAADRLVRLGLRWVGDLYAIPRAALAARCGLDALRRLDQALGDIDEPVSPLQPVASHRVRMGFAEPVATTEAIAAALDRLLDSLCRMLAQDGRGGRRFELALFRTDRRMQRLSVGTGRPLRDPAPVARLFAERLDGLDIGFGIETMLLAATVTEPLDAAQIALAERQEQDADRLTDLVAALSNRLGAARVIRYLPLESHMPDRAYREVPAAALPAPPRWDRPRDPIRPLRLLCQPEVLETAALPVKDAPPGGFRWRRRSYRVQAAVGPERILPEWWRGTGAWDGGARDYWRVQAAEGGQFWIFRKNAPGVPSRWFMHGLFH